MLYRGWVSQPLLKPSGAGGLEQWLRAYVRQDDLFSPGDRVLVAVSGGPDSVALLHLLKRLEAEWGLALGVGHFDHGLRGRESREEAAFVADLARGLGLPFYLGQGDVAHQARTRKTSVQAAARQLRLHFLNETCRSQGYQKLALGHTADDQVELFFLRLLRGTGPEGLKGMWPATPAGVVRPLLAVGKEVILAWLEEESLVYREDSSNLSRRYLRNRLRLDLLPELTRRYNPQLKKAVWRSMALLQEQERLLAQETARVWPTVARTLTPDFIALKLPELFQLPTGWQKRLLRVALGKFLVDQEITMAQVANLLALAQGRKSGGLIPRKDCQVARAGGELHFWRPLPAPPTGAVTLFPASRPQVESAEGWRWQCRTLPQPPSPLPGPEAHTAWLDADRVTFPLEMRYFRPGERFWPLGAPGPKKLQDFLVNSKIPRWLRGHLPLVVSAGEIIWVAGLRLAETVKLTSLTQNALELKISPNNPYTNRVWETLLAWRGGGEGEKGD
ncbi:MAG: tRNA lysidine(34) synthetase TilS [Deltaproteobacteria bacterium RBG_13_58_19]|nr:MAG: tRNA lysidine(34) synthetase TilS [Deltaproteobacteria bacterium RBG_13_58_19]